jgi:clan AA aspartic protease
MGIVMVTARIGASAGLVREVEFLVDRGAFYTVIPPGLLDDLGIEVRHRERVVTTDNRMLAIDLGSAHVEIEDRSAAILVGRMDVPAPLLGVSALEAFGFKVNPVDGTLEPARPFPGIPAL